MIATVVVLLLILGIAAFLFPRTGFAPDSTVPPGAHLRVAFAPDIRGLDPHAHGCTVTESVLVNIYDYLIWRTPEGGLEPALATDWEIIDDRTWRLSLRPDVRWHDGETFDASDVIFTLARLAGVGCDVVTPHYPHFRDIEAVEAIDDLTLDITTRQPDPSLPYRLSRSGAAMLPAHVEPDIASAPGNPSPQEGFVGTGPYRVAEWSPGGELRLEAFPEHWRGPAAVTHLTFEVVPEARNRAEALLGGKVDVATNLGDTDWRRIFESESLRLPRRVGPQVVTLGVRHEPEYATSDPRIREAIELSVDSQYLVDQIMAGAATPTRTHVTPASPGSHPDLYNTYLFDPEASRALLREAGYDADDRPTITLLAPEDRYPGLAELAVAVSEMIDEVGIGVQLDLQPWPEYLALLDSGNHPALTLRIDCGCLGDPIFSFEPFWNDEKYRNPFGFEDPNFEAELERARRETRGDARRRYLHSLAESLAESRPQIPLVHLLSTYGVHRGVDWSPRPDELLWMWPAVKGQQ